MINLELFYVFKQILEIWLNVSFFSGIDYWGYKSLIACPSSLIYAVKIFTYGIRKIRVVSHNFVHYSALSYTEYFNKVLDLSYYQLLLKVFLRFHDFAISSLFPGLCQMTINLYCHTTLFYHPESHISDESYYE